MDWLVRELVVCVMCGVVGSWNTPWFDLVADYVFIMRWSVVPVPMPRRRPVMGLQGLPHLDLDWLW